MKASGSDRREDAESGTSRKGFFVLDIDKRIIDHLEGSVFTSGLRVRISHPERKIAFRMETIEKLVRGKRIIHLGCADHVPLIARKIRRNKWFHKRLVECTERCLGVDIDANAVGVMRTLGYTDVIVADLSVGELPGEIADVRWDFLVMGEILEHVDDPVAFLRALDRRVRRNVNRIIVSTPHAFRSDNFKAALSHVETVNSDHRYWFTPYTLAKIGARAGLHAEKFQLCQSYAPAPYRLLRRAGLVLFPGLRDTIVMVFRPSEAGPDSNGPTGPPPPL
jgi:2-polyprenyl-3-methyl-5-hydroxy-6-metoxy-1,4-benzoquinol methylase